MQKKQKYLTMQNFCQSIMQHDLASNLDSTFSPKWRFSTPNFVFFDENFHNKNISNKFLTA